MWENEAELVAYHSRVLIRLEEPTLSWEKFSHEFGNSAKSAQFFSPPFFEAGTNAGRLVPPSLSASKASSCLRSAISGHDTFKS